MFYHFTLHNDLHWFPGAWVAVDLFFILSGFVISHSYWGSISNGMSLAQFIAARILRLAPLYFIGLAIGTAAAILALRSGQSLNLDASGIFSRFILALSFIPYLNGGPIFPLNDPSWSLFFEVFVNIIFFWHIRKWGSPSGIILVCAAAVAFLVGTLATGRTNPGWATGHFSLGFPRAIAEFFAGCLIYQTGIYRRTTSSGMVVTLTALTFLGFLIDKGKVGFISSLTIIPLTISFASSAKLTPRVRRVCIALGEISYPLYIIHYPVYFTAQATRAISQHDQVTQTLILAAASTIFSAALIGPDRRFRTFFSEWLEGVRRAKG
ncbi:MAG: acyltransferase [Burkholderiales bacterium]|nr:acyltransferase [Burkholderiales bacterium]